jgi:hypothetical protein
MSKISTKDGQKIWLNMLYHDDGVDHIGGENCCIVGKMGSGKSTLVVQIAEYSRYSPECSRQEYIDYLFNLGENEHYDEPEGFGETVLWRGRKYDYWNCLIPKNWVRSFPNYAFDPKPVVLHVHKNDDLKFFHKIGDERFEIPAMPEIRPYDKASDLFDNIERGAINVVYEPQVYVLSPNLVKKLKAKKMDPKGDDDDDTIGEYLYVPPPVFWFELVEYMMEKKGNEFYTIIMDEFHQVCPSSSLGDMWHLIDWFSNSYMDIRKNNISLFVSTHQCTLVDWRVLDRTGHFIWLPGSKISKKNSMIYNSNIVSMLVKGQGLIERRMERFGLFNFSRINKQPPLVRVEGMSNII